MKSSDNFLSRENFIWLLIAQAVSILPLLVKLPPWVWGIWIVALAWRIQIYRNAWRFPSPIIKLLLGAVCVFGIVATYHTVAGVEPMVGFLVCSFVLKLIELRTRKDALTILYIGFIAVATQFLFAQTIVAALLAIFCCVTLITAWQASQTRREKHPLAHLRGGADLIVQSLPFMVILFVFLPRLGPLWSVPLPSGQGKTGFGDTLTLGDIGNLVRSPEPAFRVTFEGSVPQQGQLYFKGMVLEDFDGETWAPGRKVVDNRKFNGNFRYDNTAKTQYSIILEPHFEHWMFSLGVPMSAESSTLTITNMYGELLRSRKPIVKKAEYWVTSIWAEDYEYNPLDAREIYRLTTLPNDNKNLESRRLVQQWKAQGLNEQEVVNAALDMFSREFSYTLQPPLLGDSAIDEFLFSSKKGFCEHFASSFVFLMREAGIPARIVVGYQGGEFNQVEPFLLVRQSDAHAWAEIWLEGRWQNIDPTAMVAPSRIELGVQEALVEEDRALMRGQVWHNQFLQKLSHQLDAMNYSWNRWVLNYSDDKQQNLFWNQIE